MGTFSSQIATHYNRVSYTDTDTNVTYYNISIFKTDSSCENIAPAVYVNGSKQQMENMNPPGISAGKIIAKTNAGSMTYGQYGDAFYGTYYVNGTIYRQCAQMSGPTDSRLDNLWARDFPCFCVKKDGTANIRWPSKIELQDMLQYCSSILASLEPLVYNSKNVFTTAVYDAYDTSMRIANGSNLNDANCRYNDYYCANSGGSRMNRTFLGHKLGGAYGTFFLVCVDRDTMDLCTGAKLMKDLGCDYAVNMDGAAAVKMRVASGYSGSYPAGQMTGGGTDYYGACVCAYLV